MGTWHDYLKAAGTPPEWPYPIKIGEETEVETDVLVLGGGIAGCWAAISAARSGAKVALLEKGDVKRSGCGGPGCDHWCNVPANPLSRVDPDEWAIEMINALGDYSNGIGIEIQCREDYDTLLEMEQMGGKIRDDKDEFLGVEGRDPETKFMFSPRYGKQAGYAPHPDWQKPGFNPPEERNNVVIRIWGSTFKPILKKECKKLGVQIFDRVMVTSLLNENGKQGARVVGATGLNSRTGEFIVVKAKASIIAMAGFGQLWDVNMEQGGYSYMASRNQTGDGPVIAWRAGASLTSIEGSHPFGIAGGLKHKWYTGGGDASYENVPIVDANNVQMVLPTQGWADGGAMPTIPNLMKDVRDGIESGKFELPLYGDFAAMKPEESNATWNLMLNEESTTKIMVKTMTEGGFDPTRDQIMNYSFTELQSPPQHRSPGQGGGILHDWDLKTTLDGLYVAGGSTFTPEDHSYAASTGRYAGRKAAAYAKTVDFGEISREQVDKEKARVLAPAMRSEGIEWKELHNGLCRVMQYYVSQYQTDRLYKLALEEIARIEENAVPQLYALDPHKLMRSVEDLNLIESAKMIIYATMERKLSSPALGMQRLDYPEPDEEELKHYLVLHQEDGEVKYERIPIRFWGNMKEQYEAHNQDYTGVYKG